MERTERRFKTAEEFETFFGNGDLFTIEPWMRKQQEAKNICVRRFAVWCEQHKVPEEYEAMVLAIEDYYADLRAHGCKDRYDEWNLQVWEALLRGEVPELFCEPEDASD